MTKAKKDTKARALLNMLSDMDQQEANAQVKMVLFNKVGSSPMTGEYPHDIKPRGNGGDDKVSSLANEKVDQGEYEDYDDAYNSIVRKMNRYGKAFILKEYGLPLQYETENILVEMFEGTGIELKQIGKDSVVVVIKDEEEDLPIERDENGKIQFVKGGVYG